MLTTIFVVILILIAIILLVAATKPDTFVVERSLTMNTPAEKISPLINDFHKWTQWSPYENLDPNMKRTYSGAAEGKGAAYAWEGTNNKAGSGRMEITESLPQARIALDLNFTKPFAANNQTEFLFQNQSQGTNVTWRMSGKYNFMAKVMCIFMNMDKMVGTSFEEGLQNLKTIVEK